MADDWPNREYFDVANGEAAITGWTDFDGAWHDVDKGDAPPNIEAGEGLDMEGFTFHYVSDEGDDVYYHVHGVGFDDWEQIAEAIEDTLDRYGVTAS